MVVSRQPIFIVNLKSNTMKNTLQMYMHHSIFPKNMTEKSFFLN